MRCCDALFLFYFFFTGANVKVFRHYMKGCIGRLTCLPLIYCLLSWNGRIAVVRTAATQQGASFYSVTSDINASAVIMQLSSWRLKSIISWKLDEGCKPEGGTPSAVALQKECWFGVETAAYNNDDCSLLLSHWALTWDASADSGSTLLLTSTEFLFGSAWLL